MSYSFQPRTIKSKQGGNKRLIIFSAGICQQAKLSIREKLRKFLPTNWTNQTLTWFAKRLNPKIRGWINYYAAHTKHEVYSVFYYLNTLILHWIKTKYKIRGKTWLYEKYQLIQKQNPALFYHWKLGIKA